MGFFQYRILVASGLCFAADAMQVLLLSFLSIVLRDQWGLSDEEAAFITSILFAGALVGTSILGPLADKWGRRPVFLMAAAIIAVFGLATSLCQNYISILVIMGLIGFGVGGLVVCTSCTVVSFPFFWLLFARFFKCIILRLVLIERSHLIHWRNFCHHKAAVPTCC